MRDRCVRRLERSRSTVSCYAIVMDNPCASADEDFITEGGCTTDYGVADVVVGHNSVGRSVT